MRSSCWPPVVSAAAGGLAPVGFKQLGTYTAASILAHSFASPLAGTCKKTPRVFSDGTCAPAKEEVPARATAAPVP